MITSHPNWLGLCRRLNLQGARVKSWESVLRKAQHQWRCAYYRKDVDRVLDAAVEDFCRTSSRQMDELKAAILASD